VVKDAVAAGVALRAVSPLYAQENGPAGLILGFGGFSDQAIDTAASKLGAILRTAGR
jgi:GntR family transcriptional regulator/MocR family aminotransferase